MKETPNHYVHWHMHTYKRHPERIFFISAPGEEKYTYKEEQGTSGSG